jgi:prepilin-type N-terminal cleavage/methylation domain-containing protein
MPRRRAFTLVEILVVISIMVVLAALTLAVLNKAEDAAKMNATRELMLKVKMTLEDYADDFDTFPAPFPSGSYPVPLDEMDTTHSFFKDYLLDAGHGYPEDHIQDLTGDDGEIDEFDRDGDTSHSDMVGVTGALTDAWDQPIYYKEPASSRYIGLDYELWSKGPNELAGLEEFDVDVSTSDKSYEDREDAEDNITVLNLVE